MKIKLPEFGIYDSDGNLFHHKYAARLYECHYKRLEEHGFNVRECPNYSIDETVIIFKNWKRYCDETGKNIMDSLRFLGVGAKRKEKDHLLEQEETNFWPRLCRGLPHRKAYSVSARAKFVLLPEILELIDWNDEDQIKECINREIRKHAKISADVLKKVKKLLEQGVPARIIYKKLNIRLSTTRAAISILQAMEKNEKNTKPAKYSGFYDIVSMQSIKNDDYKFASNLKKFITREKEEKLKALGDKLDWKIIAKEIKLDENEARNKWEKLKKKLKKNYTKNRENGLEKEEAFEASFKKYVGELEITPKQFVTFMDILCRYMLYENKLVITNIDRTNVEKALLEEGVTKFRVLPQHDELAHLFRLTHGRYKKCEDYLFYFLRTSYTIREKMHVVLWASKRLSIWDKIKLENDQTKYEAVIELEKENKYITENTSQFLKLKRVKKWLNEDASYPKSGSSKFQTYCVECFILFFKKKCKENFVFPQKMRNKIISNVVKKTIENDEDGESEYVNDKIIKKELEKVAKFDKRLKKFKIRKMYVPTEKKLIRKELEEPVEELNDCKKQKKRGRKRKRRNLSESSENDENVEEDFGKKRKLDEENSKNNEQIDEDVENEKKEK